MRLLPLCLLFLPALATAEPVQIPGPDGPLEAEAMAVDGAKHALVIIPGSGPTDRDGNSTLGLHSDAYRMLAEALADEGIASLRIDKRGFGGSEGAVASQDDITIEGYADDARAWVARAHEMAPCVWLAGHSEGGLVALVAAASEPPEGLCGVILLAAPGRPIGRILVDQVRLVHGGADIVSQVDDIVTDLEAGRTRDPDTLPELLQTLFRPGVQRYMIDLFSWDPVVVALDWSGPTLIVQGDADTQISTGNAARLAVAMPQAVRVDLPGATHMMKVYDPDNQGSTYTDPTIPLHADLVPAIAGFLADNDPQD